jgi:hypothetical protein
MGRDIFQQQMEFCVELNMSLVFAKSELQARRGKVIEISCWSLELWVLLVTTLTLGLRRKQGVARVRVKKKTWESHHILPGMQRVWGHEPSHSQVNSHVGSWNPDWTPKSLECDSRGQNSSPWKVFYIIGNLFKRKCLKWACIAHLNICNPSYGQKKGRESN